MSMGVANVHRDDNGTRYNITDDDSHKVGIVEVVNNVYGIRDRDNEPVRVGSALYHAMRRAVNHYEEWAGRDQWLM